MLSDAFPSGKGVRGAVEIYVLPRYFNSRPTKEYSEAVQRTLRGAPKDVAECKEAQKVLIKGSRRLRSRLSCRSLISERS